MPHSLNAWLLTLNSTTKIAVADSQMTEYLLDSAAIPIPLTPQNCHNVTLWRNQIIPLITVTESDKPNASTHTYTNTHTHTHTHTNAHTNANIKRNQTLPRVQIVHYQENNPDCDSETKLQSQSQSQSQPQPQPQPQSQFIALQLQIPPQQITLENNTLHPPEPHQQQTWKNALISSFKYQDQLVSIVDFASLKSEF